MDSDNFWLVWRLGRGHVSDGHAPGYKHYSESDARAEAERLARANRGATFYVMAVVAHVTEPLPPVVWSDAQQQTVDTCGEQPY